jgi:hypothetical protein
MKNFSTSRTQKKKIYAVASSIILLIAFITFFITPITSFAFFCLVLIPALFGVAINFVVALIIDLIIFCALGIICGSGGGGGGIPSDYVCPTNISITASLQVVQPPTRWSNETLVQPGNYLWAPKTVTGQEDNNPGPTKKVGPADTFRFNWSSTNATHCFISVRVLEEGDSESTSGSPLSGSYTFIAAETTNIPENATVRELRNPVRVVCYNETNGCGASVYLGDMRIPPPQLDRPDALTIFPPIVRFNETARIGWNILADNRVPYTMSCQLTGTVENPFTFTIPAQRTGTITSRPLRSRSRTRLVCTEPISGVSFDVEKQVDVIPQTVEI